MTDSQKDGLVLTCTVAGSPITCLVYYFVWSAGVQGSNVDFGGVFDLFWLVVALIVGFPLGYVFGRAVVWVIPKPKTKCLFCGSPKAIPADNRLWDGKPYPNHCPACGQSWDTTEELPHPELET